MVRNGGFCTYNGNEYELTEDMDGNLLILTEDPFLAKDGFVDKWGSGVYSKKVSPNEISNCYRITTKGKINGKIVHISKENEKEIGRAHV